MKQNIGNVMGKVEITESLIHDLDKNKNLMPFVMAVSQINKCNSNFQKGIVLVNTFFKGEEKLIDLNKLIEKFPDLREHIEVAYQIKKNMNSCGRDILEKRFEQIDDEYFCSIKERFERGYIPVYSEKNHTPSFLGVQGSVKKRR